MLPILMFLILLIAQTTLLTGANVFIHYAAFAATRSAIVQVPRDLGWTDGLGGPAEPANVVVIGRDSAKLAAIREAAVFALVPVSGRLASGDVPAQAFADGLRRHYAEFDRGAPGWVGNLAADRLRYADANTRVALLEARVPEDRPGRVELVRAGEGSVVMFGPKDPITVRVTHHQNLVVPYVAAIFASDADATDPEDFPHAGDGRYSRVSAHYTLSNEGIAEALPPPAALPRDRQ